MDLISKYNYQINIPRPHLQIYLAKMYIIFLAKIIIGMNLYSNYKIIFMTQYCENSACLWTVQICVFSYKLWPLENLISEYPSPRLFVHHNSKGIQLAMLFYP